MPRPLVLSSHLAPTSLRPRPYPPLPERVRILVDPRARSLSTPRLATTHGGGVSPATPDPTHRPDPATVLAPRTLRLALANVYPVQLPRRLSSFDAGSAVARVQTDSILVPPCATAV